MCIVFSSSLFDFVFLCSIFHVLLPAIHPNQPSNALSPAAETHQHFYVDKSKSIPTSCHSASLLLTPLPTPHQFKPTSQTRPNSTVVRQQA